MTRWKGLLALAVAVSITGNVTHALLVAPTIYGWGAAISASIAPVFLFWHTHNLITAPEEARGGNWVGVSVIAAVALGAFAVSFMGLRELLVTFGFTPAIAVILPLVVDVTIAGASWELVREDERVGVSVHHQHMHQVILADQQITEATNHVIQAEPANQDSVIPAVQSAESGDFPVVGHLADRSENQVEGHVDQALAGQPTGAHQVVPDREADQSTDHVDQVANRHQVHAVGQDVDQDEAEIIAESRGLSAAQLREVFGLLDEGHSQRETARRTGVTQSQISRLVAERKKLAQARTSIAEGAAA